MTEELFWNFASSIDDLAQDCSNCSALAMELLQSSVKPSIWWFTYNTAVLCKRLSESIIRQPATPLGPLLLTWINFNPSMDQ